jgi:hypothetical protein
MSAVQRLRAQAQSNGKLQSTSQENVTTQTQNGQTAIQIVPADPAVVYVPVYNPEWVWGPPLFGYYPPLFYPGIGVGFSFLPGIDLGFYFGGGWGLWGGFGWGWGPDWFGGRIILNGNFFHRYGFSDFHGGLGGVWAHNPAHRMGVPYANRAVAQRFGGVAGARGTAGFRGAAAFRGSEAGRTEGARTEEGARSEGARSEGARSENGFSSRSAEGSHSAFGGIQNGGDARMQSDHGFSSIGHSSFGGGGGFHGGGGFGGGGGGFHGGGGGGRR